MEKELRLLTPPKEVTVRNLKDVPKAPTAVSVSNQPSEIRVNNLKPVLEALQGLREAVKKLPTTYPEVKIPPYPEIPPFPKIPEPLKEIEVSNLEELIGEDPTRYVPVRLSDGKKFYEAIQEVLAGGGRYAFVRADGHKAQARIDTSNRLEIGGTFRFNTNDIDEASETLTYIGMETSDAEWLVYKIDKSSGQQFRYATTKNNNDVTSYNDAFSNRASLTYGTISEAL